MKNLKKCVIGFSDQVPWWGLVGQTEELYFEDELARAADNKKPQLRGFDNDEASKFRITVELRQVILNYFGDEDPVGILGKTLLVVAGKHCRLDNISNEGHFLKEEKFEVGREQVHRPAGAFANNLMKPWRDLRAACPELFEDITVMQQPAAVVDAVIMSWILEDLGEQFPCSIWQRDLSGGG